MAGWPASSAGGQVLIQAPVGLETAAVDATAGGCGEACWCVPLSRPHMPSVQVRAHQVMRCTHRTCWSPWPVLLLMQGLSPRLPAECPREGTISAPPGHGGPPVQSQHVADRVLQMHTGPSVLWGQSALQTFPRLTWRLHFQESLSRSWPEARMEEVCPAESFPSVRAWKLSRHSNSGQMAK